MTKIDPTFSEELLRDSMFSREHLGLLYRRAREAALRQEGTIVELGSSRGASTVALAMAVRDAGNGHVYAIDPHLPRTGTLGGKFSTEDHDIFRKNIAEHCLETFVTHLCIDSAAAAANWNRNIDMLWIDADHSYEGVRADLATWIGSVNPDGTLILGDYTEGSEVEAATTDHLPYAAYLPIERKDNILVLHRQTAPRTMYLCGGMQSSGSTLVSMCFLQRADLDGVYDMDNPFVQQDFAKVCSPAAWVKMTIGSFRLKELADLYSAQGWQVRPILVVRDPGEIISSLMTKPYGNCGCTGDDPPLLIRLQRYLSDLDFARINGWAIVDYDRMIADPRTELEACCAMLGLPWDEAMLTWPKSESEIAYPSVGSPSLRASISGETGCFGAISNYLSQKRPPSDNPLASQIVAFASKDSLGTEPVALPPSIFRGTRRQVLEAEIDAIRAELERRRADCDRVANHPVFGRLLRAWKCIINPSLPSLE